MDGWMIDIFLYSTYYIHIVYKPTLFYTIQLGFHKDGWVDSSIVGYIDRQKDRCIDIYLYKPAHKISMQGSIKMDGQIVQQWGIYVDRQKGRFMNRWMDIYIPVHIVYKPTRQGLTRPRLFVDFVYKTNILINRGITEYPKLYYNFFDRDLK